VNNGAKYLASNDGITIFSHFHKEHDGYVLTTIPHLHLKSGAEVRLLIYNADTVDHAVDARCSIIDFDQD